ncbi:putative phosphothreonine lyase domain-containing protein [Streptomyces sp. NPDC056053]|uniref:putative phosphothreonine lyase domain-containing protein n=1 Tax=Streptomyces sp. NPDC056053 TaxID=3345696 RepID=UPI0035DBF4F7
MTDDSARMEQPAQDRPATCTHTPWLWADNASEHPDKEHLWSGKWLWFPPICLLDASWETIRIATQDGLLGYRSKAATLINARPGSDESRRPICVYTHDWRDLDDVRRVLNALRDLGIVDVLLYKTDSDTKQGLYGGGASTYKAFPGRRDMNIPRRTELLLEHHHTARHNARKAAEQRRHVLTPRAANSG